MMIDIFEVLQVAQTEISNMLTGNQYIDDVRGNDEDFFIIPVYDGEPRHEEVIAEFYFRYDPDDVFERSVWEQLNDRLVEFQLS